jgi:hypothetical protein
LWEKQRLLWALFLARKTDPENVDNEMLRGVGEGAPKLGLRGNLFNTPLTRQPSVNNCLKPWSVKFFMQPSFQNGGAVVTQQLDATLQPCQRQATPLERLGQDEQHQHLQS